MKFLIITASLMSLNTWGADEEALLRKKATLLLKRIHTQNIHLAGIDPETCKPISQESGYIKQLKNLKNGPLKNCKELVADKLRPIDEELKQVESGVLVYAPVPQKSKSNAPSAPTSPAMPEISDFESRESDSVSETATPSNSNSVTEKDHTGLTEDQRVFMLEMYDKNKESYEATEEDNLFQILSKAYTRNLKKVIKTSPNGEKP